MCNLNFVIKTDTLACSFKKLSKMLKNVTNNSYKSNRDGDGVYFSHTELMKKGKSKVNLNKFPIDIKTSNFILTHQRISTSGFEEKYTQPFETSEFIIAHNGVINDFLGRKGSDTFGFVNQFTDVFSEMKGTREKKIRKAINLLFNGLTGSFSIGIFDKQEKILYYFKNKSTNIYAYKNHNILYITTSWDNEQYFKKLKLEYKEKELEDYKIYKIYVNDKIHVVKIGKLKPYEYISTFTHADNQTYREANEWERGFLPIDKFRDIYYEVGCYFCSDKELTTFVTEDGYPICYDCRAGESRTYPSEEANFLDSLKREDEDKEFAAEQWDRQNEIENKMDTLITRIENLETISRAGQLEKKGVRRLKTLRDNLCKLVEESTLFYGTKEVKDENNNK